MNIALCVIGRYENKYAREFVYHYKALGFDKIYIYDNNFGNEEHFEQIDPIVEIVDWRDRENAQKPAYEDCYAKHNKEYEWIAFFDFDEFLVIESGEDIHAFMQRYNGFDCLLINWMVMTDNNLVYYDPRPMMERFTEPMPYDKHVSYNKPENNHVKCIVRGGLGHITFKNPHRPLTKMRCCNTKAQQCLQKTFLPYDFSIAYIKHFTTKTIEEWLNNKVVRGYPNGCTMELREKAIEKFFQRNERTKEKEAFMEQWKSEKGKIAAYALGRLGNQMFCAAAAATLAKRTNREFVGLIYEIGKHYDYNYQQGNFDSVMRNVKYFKREELGDSYYEQKHGGYLCNGFPEIPTKNYILNDFYQDATCIDKDIALELFRPYESILKEIKELYGDVSQYVCVNVRRGDYLKHAKSGFRVLSKEDIEDILREHFPNDKVLFVSDDIEWCKENFTGNRYSFVDKPCHYKPEMDLYIQTQCKANVISNSTFSWWGAYLNEKAEKVVCPWPWFDDGKINPMPNILPEEWIKWEQKPQYRIWITYHKDELVNEYGLKEDKNHRLFAVHKPIEGDNINHLNPIYSEIVTLYYVWKNQVKSDYVGFHHYRRQFNVSRMPNDNECQVYRAKLKKLTIYDQYAKHHNACDMDCIIDILREKYGWNNPYGMRIKHDNILLTCNCFFMSWENFNKLCEFLFPILFEFAHRVGCDDNIDAWREKEINDFGGDNMEGVAYQMRIQGFLAERLVSVWIAEHLKYYR